MYDIHKTTVEVLANLTLTGYRVVISHDGDELWRSQMRADSASAIDLASDIKGALTRAHCLWCNGPSYRFDDIGNIEDDPYDFRFWCNDDSCVSHAREEARHG